jgi:WD40-like Beta Propeller Repeat
MKRFWTALAVALMAILVVAGCNDYGNTFQNNTGAVLSFLSPSQMPACVPTSSTPCPDLTLTVNGSGFVLQTKVRWNGQTLVTTVPVDSSGVALGNIVTAVVPAALLAKPSVATVITINPASGAGQNGLSNPIAFIINPPPNPLPILTGIAPNTKAPGSPDFTLTLNGSSFIPASDPSGGSQVKWSGAQQRQLAIVGTTTPNQIMATVTSDLLANSSTSSIGVSVTVFNPPSPPPSGCTTSCSGGGGGGSSASATFTICGSGQSSCTPLAAAKGAGTASEMVAEETPALSADGRYVAYTALQNDRAEIFLRDTCEGALANCQPRTTLLSAAADGTPANDESHAPSMSSDGRYVAFSSAATNLVENVPPGRQVYLFDTCAGAGDSCKPSTHLVSLDPSGALVGTEGILPSVSSSGRFVAFLAVTPSHSSNQLSTQSKAPASRTNSGFRQVFIRDTCLGATNCTPKTTRISLQPGDGTGSAKIVGPVLSGSAGHVAIAGVNAATLFTRSVAVDDRVFLAITNQPH